MNRRVWFFLLGLGLTISTSLTGPAICPAMAQLDIKMLLSAIRLPPGFKIAVYADHVPGARSMSLSPSGVLFVGTRQIGSVYAVIDRDRNMQADEVITLAEGLDMPNGVAYRHGDLFVAEVHRILRYPGVEDRLNQPQEPQVVFDGFPKNRAHGWKFIRFGPDGRLYVPVGAPCNVCLSQDPVFATITRMKPDGGDFEIFASGVRNSVGFDWHPQTGELWFTDNGRDWMGDDLPPDELNRAEAKGLHFGFPFCHGGVVPDPEFGTEQSCRQYTAPAARLGPHVAALGMRFYTGSMFPKNYLNQVFIAEHGSWNRSHKIGYRVTRVTLNDNRVVDYRPFAQGWLMGENAWGRPVDVEVMADGSLLVSDDQNGIIYRISYEGDR